MPSKLYLIDGHALAYRTFFALTSGAAGGRWQTSSGEPTAGIYGFATVLMRLLENDRPDYIAVAFDTGKTFRDELFPEYKATRAKMPEDLRPQIERIRQMVDAFNIPRLEMEGFEADDVLGSIAKQAAAQGLGVKIITGDRDLLQLDGDHIMVNLPEGGKLADARDFVTDDDVRSKFGVPARLVVDYKALVGDTSDNIPGVRGVGEKTAETLIKKGFSTVQELRASGMHLLTAQQLIGLRHYEDLQVKIPRSEVEAIHRVVDEGMQRWGIRWLSAVLHALILLIELICITFQDSAWRSVYGLRVVPPR